MSTQWSVHYGTSTLVSVARPRIPSLSVPICRSIYNHIVPIIYNPIVDQPTSAHIRYRQTQTSTDLFRFQIRTGSSIAK